MAKKRKLVIIIVIVAILVDAILGLGATKTVAFYAKYAVIYSLDIIRGPQYKAILSFDSEKAVNIYLDELDNRFMESFYSDNGEIQVLTRDEYKEVTNRDSLACYNSNTNTIYTATLNGDPSVIHELGHYLDNKLDLREQQELLDIIEIEKGTFCKVKPYAKESAGEYIAEAFQCYILWPNSLKMVAPKTYEYIDSAYNSVVSES